MNDLDTLRRALRAPQEPGYPAPGYQGPADVAEIIIKGRRLRWRRRAIAAGGSACLAVAVLGAVAGIGRLTTPSSGPAQHQVSPVSPVRPVPPARTAPVPTPPPTRGHATPSTSPSATAVPTALPTQSATALPTPTPTMSASPSASASAIGTPTAGVTATSGQQPSPTATA